MRSGAGGVRFDTGRRGRGFPLRGRKGFGSRPGASVSSRPVRGSVATGDRLPPLRKDRSSQAVGVINEAPAGQDCQACVEGGCGEPRGKSSVNPSNPEGTEDRVSGHSDQQFGKSAQQENGCALLTRNGFLKLNPLLVLTRTTAFLPLPMVELFSIPPFAGLITSNKFTISEECFTQEEQV